jgi:hypothetical protein
MEKTNIIKDIFEESRIIGLAGGRNTGKTNNLMAILIDFRKSNKNTIIYYYGLEDSVVLWINKNIGNCFEISSLEQLSNKRDSLIILDEMQNLNLNDRRYKEVLNQFVDFIYHKNNRVILSSPSLREFNSIIGSKIDKWILKSLKLSSLINGSQIKTMVMNYKGRYKSINDIVVGNGEILIINDKFEKVVTLPYIEDADSKRFNKDILANDERQEIVRENVEELSENTEIPSPSEINDYIQFDTK